MRHVADTAAVTINLCEGAYDEPTVYGCGMSATVLEVHARGKPVCPSFTSTAVR